MNYKRYAVFDLEKIEDKLGGKHPNGYNEGFEIKHARLNLELSEKYGVLFVNHGADRWFHTSKITKQEEFEDHDLIHTLNSIYKISFHEVQ